MSLMDNGSNGMVMPVSPMYGGGANCCAQQTFGCGCGAA